jgi:hypothetical protein
MTPSEEGPRVQRAEWIAAGALIINVLSIVFGGGALWQSHQDHDRRIVAIEAAERARAAEMTQILVRLERIDSNTIALKERMDKDRAR